VGEKDDGGLHAKEGVMHPTHDLTQKGQKLCFARQRWEMGCRNPNSVKKRVDPIQKMLRGDGHFPILVVHLLVFSLKVGFTVKDLKMMISNDVVRLKEDIELTCSFKLQDEETLYSNKLYKGRQEFLHFVPAFKPPYKVFSTKGVSVLWSNLTLGELELHYQGASPFQYTSMEQNFSTTEFTNGQIIVGLSSVTLFSSGLYGCEVSADFPEYDTDIRRAHLHVFVPPESRPMVSGLAERYKSGERVNLTCVNRATYPAANLSWFISGRKASPAWVSPTRIATEKTSRLLSSYSRLNMPAKDKAVVKCVASILTSFWQSEDLVIRQQEPPMAPVLTDRKGEPSTDVNDANSPGGSLLIMSVSLLLARWAPATRL